MNTTESQQEPLHMLVGVKGVHAVRQEVLAPLLGMPSSALYC